MHDNLDGCMDGCGCMDSKEHIAKLVFEYTDSYGHKTRVEKEFEESWNMTPFDTLLTEIAYAMKATGFSSESIDKSILYPQ